MTKEELKGKIIVGKVYEEEYPELTDEYEKVIVKAGGKNV